MGDNIMKGRPFTLNTKLMNRDEMPKVKTTKEIVAEAIAANNAEWIAWGESECPHWAENKAMCVYCWQERKKSLER